MINTPSRAVAQPCSIAKTRHSTDQFIGQQSKKSKLDGEALASGGKMIFEVVPPTLASLGEAGERRRGEGHRTD
jgi:hypothetical protein